MSFFQLPQRLSQYQDSMEYLYDVREFPKKEYDNVFRLYFVEPEFFFFKQGMMYVALFNLTKDSFLFNCSAHFLYSIFLGGSNGILHAHNTFSRKT